METIPKVTALLTFGDVSAVGAIRAINESSLEVPKDISVIGHVDMSICEYVTPRLTSIKYPVTEMAKVATELLFDRLRENNETAPKKNVTLPLKLVIRESTDKVNLKRL